MKAHKLLLAVSLLVVQAGISSAYAATSVTLYKDAECGCCEEYVKYLQKNHFAVNAVNKLDMDAIKRKYGMSNAASCHTALIGGYAVEGHVPVGAINKLLKEKPDIIGISAPGMPQNAPGMGEMIKGTLTIYAIPKNGKRPYVFSVE